MVKVKPSRCLNNAQNESFSVYKKIFSNILKDAVKIVQRWFCPDDQVRHQIDIVFEINLRFDTNVSTLVVDRKSWESRLFSVLPPKFLFHNKARRPIQPAPSLFLIET